MNEANIGELIELLGRWATGRGPLYLLLAARLRDLIDDGLLPPDTALPPDRVLARRLAVARGTVVAAYDLLQQEARVVRRRGSGTRVAAADLPATRAANEVGSNPLLSHILHPPDGVTLLTCAAPDEPPPLLAEAFRQAVSLLPERDLGYHPAGHPALRAAVAATTPAATCPRTLRRSWSPPAPSRPSRCSPACWSTRATWCRPSRPPILARWRSSATPPP
ncbi:GntR family transcriptional regulator [Nonomuraea dietziae]|uniref:GntR family transcriptional regulator n=1 Tax=Nonomuraea dietziae TaxID=65515 RepID=UPI0031CF6894